jgi:phosphoglycerate dehydrogenase-like enzyme
MKVHLLHRFAPPFDSELALALNAPIALSRGADSSVPPDCEILIGGRPHEEHLTASQALKSLIIPWSGLPVATRELMRRYPAIAVHNIHHNAAPAAEMAFALMLATAKEIILLDRRLRRGDWRRRYEPSESLLLAGKTAVVLGYGAIGRRIGVLCRTAGMKVIGVKRTHTNVAEDMELRPVSELKECLNRSHILFVCVPLTLETSGMIGETELAALPDGAIIVNISRGEVIQQEPFYRSLLSGRLRAGLDVWYNYPKTVDRRSATLPADFPFQELENVVMTPHLAGHSAETETLRAQAIAELLNQAASGSPMPNRVNVEVGY